MFTQKIIIYNHYEYQYYSFFDILLYKTEQFISYIINLPIAYHDSMSNFINTLFTTSSFLFLLIWAICDRANTHRVDYDFSNNKYVDFTVFSKLTFLLGEDSSKSLTLSAKILTLAYMRRSISLLIKIIIFTFLYNIFFASFDILSKFFILFYVIIYILLLIYFTQIFYYSARCLLFLYAAYNYKDNFFRICSNKAFENLLKKNTNHIINKSIKNFIKIQK